MAREDLRGFYEYRKEWIKNNPDRVTITRLASYIRVLKRAEKEQPELYAQAKARAER